MKNKLILLALLAFFTSCVKSVLPEDETQRGKGKKDTLVVKSKHNVPKDYIYTVDEFIERDLGEDAVWLGGYIVGTCSRSVKNAEWVRPFSHNAALLIADDPKETKPERVVAIKLNTNKQKEEYSLAINPDNKGRQIICYGKKERYLGIYGMKRRVQIYDANYE